MPALNYILIDYKKVYHTKYAMKRTKNML